MDAYRRYGADPLSTGQRLDFYLPYLEDVVPNGVIVQHVPNHDQPYDLGGSRRAPREEIQLWYAGKMFMTGVVALEVNPMHIEEAAGNLAYIHWGQQRICVPYRHQAWSMFTGLHRIRFCSSRDGRDWERMADFHPMHQVGEVVDYFEQEFARIRHH